MVVTILGVLVLTGFDLPPLLNFAVAIVTGFTASEVGGRVDELRERDRSPT
jgi:hypothetical protein